MNELLMNVKPMYLFLDTGIKTRLIGWMNDEWMNDEWMNDEWMNEWWMNEWWMNEWMNEWWMNEWWMNDETTVSVSWH